MNTLKLYIEDSQITQAEFAKIAGLSAVDVNRVSTGARRPSMRVAFAIERATKGAISARSWLCCEAIEEGNIHAPQ